MAEKREYKPGIRRIKDFFTKGKINPKSPRARLERQKAQKQRAKGIGTSGDTDTEFKGSVKNLTKKGMARKMEDAKPTATAKAITKTEKTIAKSPAKSKPGVGGVKAGLSEFGKAFAAARKAGKKDFTFRDRQYAAVTKQEVSKAGASGLGDYLNKLKRKDSQIAKAPGQVTKKKGGMLKKAMGGSVDERDIERSIEAAKVRQALTRSLDDPKTKKANQSIDRMNRQRRRGQETPMGTRDRMAGQQFGRSLMVNGKLIRKRDLPGVGAISESRRMANEMSGAAVSEKEMKSIMDQMSKSPAEDKLATGGSVMARGCKMGRKKPTKLY